MMREKSFDINVGNSAYRLTPDMVLAYLFRKEVYQDLDYFKIFKAETEETITVMRNPDIVRYMAGIAFNGSGVKVPKNKDRQSFRDSYGWNARTVIREEPDPDEIDIWVELERDHDIAEDGTFNLPEEED